MAYLVERHRRMEEAYSRVCMLFNENAKMIEPFDFFAVFNNFLKNFQVGLRCDDMQYNTIQYNTIQCNAIVYGSNLIEPIHD